MASVNKVILLGALGQEPTTRFMPNGEAVTNFSMATSENWKDKTTGQKKESVEWHNIVAYRKLAEIIGEYMKKGSSIYIEGRLQTRKWEKDGVTRYTTEIIADSMQMLGGKSDGSTGSASHETARPNEQDNAAPAPSNFDDFDSDMPF